VTNIVVADTRSKTERDERKNRRGLHVRRFFFCCVKNA